MSDPAHHATGISLHGWNRELRWLIAICLLVIVLVASVIVASFHATQTPGVTDKEIRIGTVLALEGPTRTLGQRYLEGVTAAVDEANRKGGVHGRRIRLIVHNDDYEPLKCVLNTRDLIAKDRVFALTSYVGTPNSVKAQAIWTGAQVPVVGFFTGAQALREPFNRYNFHIRASYHKEMHAVINLFANQLRIKRVAIFYQYDAFGQSVRRDVKMLISQRGMTLVGEGSYPRNTEEVESGLKAILAGDPEAVILIGTAAPAAKLVREMRAQLKRPVYFGAASFVGAEAFATAVGEAGEGAYICQTVPLYEGAHSEVLREYLLALKESHAEAVPGYVSFEGYLNGRILWAGLQGAGRELTRERFIDALESLRNPFGSELELIYGPRDHEGFTRPWMTVLRQGKYEYVDVQE